jgi:uncharacterized protein with PIN domain
MTPEELERQLRAEAETIIKTTVEKYRASKDKTLAEIEVAALAAGKQMKQAALEGMVAARPSEAALEKCPECGGGLQAKGKRSKWIQTQAGEVQVERDYYYCVACGTGFFPQ